MRLRATSFFRSEKVFYGILALLVLQAAWLALSGRYPMAFDEDFHFGIIRLYAHHLSPFWSAQPPNADVFGAVYRDPSYLYHYLMSFPYRLISVFTNDATIQVIALRFMNIGLFAAAIILYRKLLLRLGVSRGVAHAVLALFVLIPIVPFLAAQINYDNLFLPITALFLLLALDVHDDIRLVRPLRFGKLGALVIVGLLASLVKYAFLPILATVFILLVLQSYRYLGKRKKFWQSLGFGWSTFGRRSRWVLLAVIVASIALFSERYVVNMVDYHKPVPACDQVLSVERCKAYGPWNRDYNFSLLNTNDQHDNMLAYTADWAYGMWFRTFFAVDGPATNFETRGPLAVPAVSAIVFAGIGVLAFLGFLPRILKRYDKLTLGLFGIVTLTYALALWVDNYQAYVRTGQPVAINGRYLLVVYPLLMVLLALSFQELLKKRLWLQYALAALALVCFLWGGGFLTYVLRSRDAWLWPNPTVRRVNYDLRQALTPVVPGGRKPTEYLPGS